MNLVPDTTTPQFKGLLVIHSKDGRGGIATTAINTKEVTSISNDTYIDKKQHDRDDYDDDRDDEDDDIEIANGAYMTLNNGCSVKVFAPINKVIDAYIHASEEGVSEIDAKYPALLQKPLFG